MFGPRRCGAATVEYPIRSNLQHAAAVVPWNSQLFLVAVKLGPTLAAGNTVVLKASEHTSAAMLECGGFNGSGYGRESGFQAIYDYTRPKTIWVHTSNEPMANPFVMR